MFHKNIQIACLCKTFLKDDDHPHSHPEYKIGRFDYEVLPHINTKKFETIGIEIKTNNNTCQVEHLIS